MLHSRPGEDQGDSICRQPLASTRSMDYEMYCAIVSLVPAFLDKNPSVDESHPNSLDAFKEWTLEQFSYKMDGVGSIELSTIHAAKGKEGDTYIINPGSHPAQGAP